MPDETRPEDSPVDSDDERDAPVAELLAVEPLDDLTRRRLVSTAIHSTDSESEPAGRRLRRFAVAAAIVLVAVAGAGVFAAVRDSSSTGDADTAQATPSEAERALSQDQGALSAGLPDIGEFGELTKAANVARLEAAAKSSARSSTAADRNAPPAAAGTAGAEGPASKSTTAEGSAASPESASRVIDCSPSLPEGTTVAVASGTYRGTDVLVLVREAAGGARAVYAVDATCKIHRLS